MTLKLKHLMIHTNLKNSPNLKNTDKLNNNTNSQI